MSLARSWSVPWTHKSHLSFQPSFRDALKTVALCTHRLDMPLDVVHRIGSFLRRDWWSDGKRECWNSDCQVLNISKAVEAFSDHAFNDGDCAKRFADFIVPIRSSLKACTRCNVPKYCSKRCKEDSYKASHCYCCCKPQCSLAKPTSEELQLYSDVFNCKELQEKKLPRFVQIAQQRLIDFSHKDTCDDEDAWEDDDDNDDDNIEEDDAGSWESMESDVHELKKPNPTSIIYKFFVKNSYDN
jgi:hypothetical protein